MFGFGGTKSQKQINARVPTHVRKKNILGFLAVPKTKLLVAS